MLEFDRYVPDRAQDGAPVLVLLHGRGADKADLAALRPRLPASALLITPRAPFRAAPWGYGPGWAWYRYLGADRPEPESFQTSLNEIDLLLRELPGLLPVRPGPIALGGFSQGGTVAMAFALAHPGRVPFVLNFSGFLADHPAVRASPGALNGTRFFWGHGTRDPNIPFAMAVEGRSLLAAAGADLEARDYPIGHWIDPSELRHAVEWLEHGLEPTGSRA